MSKFDSLYSALAAAHCEVKRNENLSRHTTLRVGGPARLFVTVHSLPELERAITASRKLEVPFLVLGWGSNLIVSDSGYDGLVIQNRSQNWQIINDNDSPRPSPVETGARFQPVGNEYYTADGLDYSDENEPPITVRVDSGAKLGPLMNSLFRHGITGLQWFAGIPGTVGGAIYMNMHGGTHYFGDLMQRATLFDGESTKKVDRDYFEFDYDWSILHETREVVLQADLRLRKGEVRRAMQLARDWAARKSLQPQISAGCIFRNLSNEEQARLNLPTPSTGYLIEHVLQLKGTRRGDAIISPRHAAFIENLGKATASEVVSLIEMIREKAKARLDLDLVTEVELIGKF